MLQNFFSQNKNILLWAVLGGFLTAFLAIAPQFDLWLAKGENWHGVYAVNDLDEPFYAAYVQSLIDGKPRRNSPVSGAQDSAENPQKESYLSVQFLATYPTVVIAKALGLRITGAMIALSLIAGFLSALAIFWLFYLFSRNAPLSFAGTTVVLFGGALAAGQGSLVQTFFPESVHFPHSLIFLRRSVPATAFPALFLFFACTFKIFTAAAKKDVYRWSALAVLCFAFTVYSYFYFWTTALAWFTGLVLLQAVFCFENIRRYKTALLGLVSGFALALLPYLISLTNRSTDVDASLSLIFTREPDLWRTPEIISYLTIALIFLFVKYGFLSVKDPKTVFLLSFALVAPAVFNQQIVTGRSLQPFHYEFFCANYISLFALATTVLIVLEKKLSAPEFKKVLALAAVASIAVGAFDTFHGTLAVRERNIRRDELARAANRLKTLSRTAEEKASAPDGVVLSFDFTQNENFDSIDLPALSTQPVLWSPHLSMFPDIDSKENLRRIFQALYYQNFDRDELKAKLRSEHRNILLLGLFSADRTSALYTGTLKPVSDAEIEEVAARYETFQKDFSAAEAASPALSFVLVQKSAKNDFAALDRWYERSHEEEIGSFILYRVRRRTP